MTDHFKNLWLCLDAMAAALQCDQGDAEKILDELETELATRAVDDRDNARRKMICVIGQLSRLEVRMMANHGPVRPPIG